MIKNFKLISIKNLTYLIWIIMFGTLGSKWQYSKINLSSINELINILRFLSFFIFPLLFYFYSEDEVQLNTLVY